MTYEELKAKGLIAISTSEKAPEQEGDSVVTIVERRYDEITGVLGEKESRTVSRSEIAATRDATQRDLDSLNAMLADIDAVVAK